MGLDSKQFADFIVTPTLTGIGLYSHAARNLIVGTPIIETRLSYIKQIGGNAVSIMQIEPFTYSDLLDRLVRRDVVLFRKITSYLQMPILPLAPDYLMGNLTAAVIFARLKYYFDPEALPAFDDPEKLAQYYKRIYNTPSGKADMHIAVNVFKSVIGGFPFKA